MVVFDTYLMVQHELTLPVLGKPLVNGGFDYLLNLSQHNALCAYKE